MRKRKILVVDDDVPLAESIKLNLEDMGSFEVRVECQSTLAMAAAREFQPEVILLDIVMPGLDGGDISAQLQEDPQLRSVPVIVVTALVANGEAGLEDGVSSAGQVMIAKPVKFDKLLNAIEQALTVHV